MAVTNVNAWTILALNHSKLKGTIEEMVAYAGANCISRHLKLNYCPNISGDIGAFGPNVYNGSAYTDETQADQVKYPALFSVHHTMVHGYPLPNGDTTLFRSKIEYYACPNATPEDFDNTLKALVEQSLYAGSAYTTPYPTASWVGNVYVGSNCTIAQTGTYRMGYSREAGTRIMQVNGDITISNRRTSASDQYVTWLRAAGWTVTEVDDSLEDGIYAAND